MLPNRIKLGRVPQETFFEDTNNRSLIKRELNDLYYLREDADQLVEAVGGRSRGEVMEIGIVDAWNNNGKLSSEVESLLGEQSPPIPSDAPVKIVETIKKQLKKKGKAEVLGAEQIEVSDDWKKFWKGGKVPASTKTPKTDFKLVDARVSLKSGDAAQLMSGGKNESRATFYTAAEKAGDLKKSTFNRAKKTIENLSESSLTKGTLAKAIREGQDKLVAAADKAHKELKKDMETLFNQSPEFKREFAYEAMSGLVKFNNNDGTCDYFLCVDWSGDVVKLKFCTDREYVEHIAEQMKISVRFKSTSQKAIVKGKKTKTGNYRYWSVIGLLIDKLNEDVESAPDDIQQLMYEEVEYLDEVSFGKVTTFLKDLWGKAIAAIKKLLSDAFKWISDNLRRLLIFLGFVPEIPGWSVYDDSKGSRPAVDKKVNQGIDFLAGDEGNVAEINLS